jgi:hypothetical protein
MTKENNHNFESFRRINNEKHLRNYKSLFLVFNYSEGVKNVVYNNKKRILIIAKKKVK